MAGFPLKRSPIFRRPAFSRCLQPKRYGGYELDPQTFFEIQMAVARGCMSTAWVYGVVGVHNWQLALFDERAQQDVWGKDHEHADRVDLYAGGTRDAG